MGYNQSNNPFSRKASPLNAQCPKGWTVNPDKDGPACLPPKKGKPTPEAEPRKKKEGPSRRSSEEGISRQKYGGNKGDLRRSAPRDYEAPSRHGSMKGDQSATHVDYAHYKGTDKGYHGHTGASHGDQSATHRDYIIDPRTHSPLSNASQYGIQGVNESDWIKYGGDVIDETAQKHEGMSRMSSPLNSDGKWIQKAFADVKARGTEGVCTGDKFGSSSCPPGSKRYNMAKTLRKMAKNR